MEFKSKEIELKYKERFPKHKKLNILELPESSLKKTMQHRKYTAEDFDLN